MKNKKLLLTLATIIAMFLYININKIYSVTLKNNSNSILFNNSEELDFRNSLNINLLAQNYEKKTIDITFLALGDDEHAESIKNMDKVPVFIMDGDEAGIKAAEKAAMLIDLCKAYESKEGILRTLSANQRRQ